MTSPKATTSSPLTMSSPSKRRDMDVMKLMMSDYDVTMANDSAHEMYVTFHGPKDSTSRAVHCTPIVSPLSQLRTPDAGGADAAVQVRTKAEFGRCTSSCPSTIRTSLPR